MPTETGDFIEIFLLFLLLYLVMKFMQGTIAGTFVRGVGFLLMLLVISAMLALSSYGMDTIEAIFKYLLGVSVIALLVIFQPELRRGLMRVGRNPVIGRLVARDARVVDEVVKAALTLSKDRIGALITFEGDVALDNYISAGVAINSDIKAELIDTIFWPGSALHDGAIVISEDRIAAGSCLFPLTEDPEISRHLGTRHRAAIGLTEETDALCVVVSEETGTISVAHDGKLNRDLDEDQLRATLRETWQAGGRA
jgi:diadenylate cyclase